MLHLFASILLFVVYLTAKVHSEEPPFPDIFKLLVGRDGLRFQYELNTLSDNKAIAQVLRELFGLVHSILVDEAYSIKHRAGRLMLFRGEAAKEPRKAFHWIRDGKSQIVHWLQPFTCTSAQASLDEAPLRSGLFSGHLLPMNLESLMSYSQSHYNGFSLQGLSALLANVIEHYVKDLQYYSRESHHQQPVAEWSLNTFSTDTIIEFSFYKTHYNDGERDQVEIDDFIGLCITISKEDWTEDVGRSLTVVAQITVLKAEFDFPEATVRIPQGYSCRSSLSLPFTKPLIVGTSASQSNNSGRSKYTLQVTVSMSRFLSNHYGEFTGSSSDQFSMLNPIDSMQEPQSSSSQFTLLVDIVDRIIAIISPKESNYQPSLTTWDLRTERKQVVHRSQSGSTCDSPEPFKSSLFQGNHESNAKVSGAICNNEQVEVKLSDRVSIKLNDAGLKLINFSLQNKENQAQLIDISQTSDVDWELTYEMPAHDLLCIKLIENDSRPNDKAELPFNSIRLITKYSYSLRSNIWTPKLSTLLVFDETQTRLMIAINFYLVHSESYKPWTKSHHLLDLSACKSGPKESARVRIEYPLTRDSSHLRQVEAPRELIRMALFNYLLRSYSISFTRIPSIEVNILEDLVRVDIRLLERWDLLSDSDRLPTMKAIDEGQYLVLLREASRSVLSDSESSCAEYCQHYQCTQYVFCHSSLACYLFHSVSGVNLINSSYASEHLRCDAFNVLSSRLDIGGAWRKGSWSLEEILESLVGSCEPTSGDDMVNDQFSSFLASKKNIKTGDQVEDSIRFARMDVMQPSLQISATLNSEVPSSKLISLYPSFADYSYERVSANAFVRGDDENQAIQDKLSEPSLAYFQLALSGFQFFERASIVKHNEHSQLDYLEFLISDKGYLTFDARQLEDCSRHCLADIGCLSFSYCSNGGGRCIITNLSRTDIDHLFNEDHQAKLDLIIKPAEECAIAVRTYSDQFERFERRDMVSGHAGRLMSDVVGVFGSESAEDCAARCINNRANGLLQSAPAVTQVNSHEESEFSSNTCLSYDFCRSVAASQPASCVLFKRRLVPQVSSNLDLNGLMDEPDILIGKRVEDSRNLLEILKKELKMEDESDCWHYVRNFLSDFHRINNRRLADNMKALVLKNFESDKTNSEPGSPEDEHVDDDRPAGLGDGVSLTNCARLCEEDPNCGAFEYCAASHKLAPNGLYLACSIGTNTTLEMAPPELARTKPIDKEQPINRGQQDAELNRLSKSRICSVYTYKSLSLILNHKKKNLAQLGAEILDEAADESQSAWLSLVRFDLLVLLAFFLFGLIVRDLNPDQFGFKRLNQAQSSSARTPVESVGRRHSAAAAAAGQISAIPTNRFIVECDNNQLQLDTIVGRQSAAATAN